MEKRRQTDCQLLLALSLFLNAVFVPMVAAQTQVPTLDEILARLEDNLTHYEKQVPDFFCNEHVVSMLDYAKERKTTATDSIFRIKRSSTGGLTESREIVSINNTPAHGGTLSGPTILSGVFSHGLNLVSIRQKDCMSYTMEPVSQDRPDAPYVIAFAALPKGQRGPECVLREDGSGRVLIDRATMQITRMELTVPNHAINRNEIGVWEVAIDYAPVVLDGKKFWMPMSISSTATPSNVYAPTVYSFSARYADYHMLEVSSHIVPVQ